MCKVNVFKFEDIFEQAELGQAQQSLEWAGLNWVVAEYIGNKANYMISNDWESDPIHVLNESAKYFSDRKVAKIGLNDPLWLIGLKFEDI